MQALAEVWAGRPILGERSPASSRIRITLDKSPLVTNGERAPATRVEQFETPKMLLQFAPGAISAASTSLIWFSNQGIAVIEPVELRLGSSCCIIPKAGRRNWPDDVSLKFAVVPASPTANNLRPMRPT